MANQQKPSIQKYLSIQHYLQDLYEYRKAHEPDFSYEFWAQELDFTNRSFLRQVVTGRRGLTIETAQVLKKRLNLVGSDKDYFDLLIQYSRAKKQSVRDQLGRQMVQIIEKETSRMAVQEFTEFVADPLRPRLQTLLSFKDIQKTPESLAQILHRPLTEVSAALEVLEKIEMAYKDTEGQWQAMARSFKVGEELGSQALLNYHRQSLDEAIAAQNLPVQERRFKSLLLPLNSEEFAAFLQEYNEFADRMRRKFDVDDLRGRKLHQVNFNIHSVSV